MWDNVSSRLGSLAEENGSASSVESERLQTAGRMPDETMNTKVGLVVMGRPAFVMPSPSLTTQASVPPANVMTPKPDTQLTPGSTAASDAKSNAQTAHKTNQLASKTKPNS